MSLLAQTLCLKITPNWCSYPNKLANCSWGGRFSRLEIGETIQYQVSVKYLEWICSTLPLQACDVQHTPDRVDMERLNHLQLCFFQQLQSLLRG